jgi:hypothetical protein
MGPYVFIQVFCKFKKECPLLKIAFNMSILKHIDFYLKIDFVYLLHEIAHTHMIWTNMLVEFHMLDCYSNKTFMCYIPKLKMNMNFPMVDATLYYKKLIFLTQTRSIILRMNKARKFFNSYQQAKMDVESEFCNMSKDF